MEIQPTAVAAEIRQAFDRTHAGETWFVALGAGVAARGEVSNSGQNYNKQVAATVASCLGIPFQPSGQEAGTLIPLCGRTLQASVAP